MLRTRCLAVLFSTAFVAAAAQSNWKAEVDENIPLFGHRNWIVVADSAYPDQSAPGITTVVSGADQAEVLQYVLNALAHSRHVAPTVYADRELSFLGDEDVVGITAFREQLKAILQEKRTVILPHEDIIRKLDDVSRTFRVLLIKTNSTLPYTTVFLQLDCAYWPPDAEAKLRKRIAAATRKPASGK